MNEYHMSVPDTQKVFFNKEIWGPHVVLERPNWDEWVPHMDPRQAKGKVVDTLTH